MSRRSTQPVYSFHKASGQAKVRIRNRDYYLGPYDSPESRKAYDAIIANWRLDTEEVDPFTTTVDNAAASNFTGSAGQLRVPSSYIAELELPIPPLPEQRRIVSKLELLLGKVSSSQQRLSRVPRLLKRFRQSVLAAACSGKLTADWRDENPTTQEYQLKLSNSGVDEGEFPPKWHQTTLGPLIQLVTSGSRGWAKYYADSGSLFIRAQNINSDVLRLDDIAFVRIFKRSSHDTQRPVASRESEPSQNVGSSTHSQRTEIESSATQIGNRKPRRFQCLSGDPRTKS